MSAAANEGGGVEGVDDAVTAAEDDGDDHVERLDGGSAGGDIAGCAVGVARGALPREAAALYRTGVAALVEAGIPFLVGGAYAIRRYTGIHRHTKDFDIFVRPDDAEAALDTLRGAGFRTEMPYRHWLGKAHGDGAFIDVIFSSGNGVATVDDAWFEYSSPGEVLGLWLPVVPPEEMIWSKAFVAERERYDGADIAHVLRALAEDLDWERLLARFGDDWRVLLTHLVLFGYVYPAERGRLPAWVMEQLIARLQHELVSEPPPERTCRGTLLSREQYLVDIDEWRYKDARLSPATRMSAGDVAVWTAAIERERATYDHHDQRNQERPGDRTGRHDRRRR